MEESVKNDLDSTFKAIEDDLKKEFNELARKSQVKSVYDGGKKLTEIVEQFVKMESDFNEHYKKETERVNKRYSKEVASEKLTDLYLDHNSKKEMLKLDLMGIAEKELKYRKEAIRNKTSSPEYRATRNEAVQILLNFGTKLDVNSTLELLEPIIEAKDLTYLKALSNTQNKETRYIYRMAIEETEKYLNVSSLEKAVNDAKRYISNPGKGRSLALEQYICNVDVGAYERMNARKIK